MTEQRRSIRHTALLRLFACLLCLFAAATTSADTASQVDSATGDAPPAAWVPRVGVITMGPGAEYWSRFGHNALIITQPSGPALSYNYGYFDFAQPNFLIRFVRGKMLYTLAVSDLDRELWQYGQEGRSVRLQWLRLDPGEAQALAAFLAWNAQPEHAEYRYDYFLANCSTRVRDALDDALHGRLREAGGSRSRGLTYRAEALRLGADVPWMMLGMHLLLGPDADARLSRWNESFLPEHFASLLAITQRDDGTPLVEETIELLPQTIAGSADSPPRFGGRALLLGSLLGVVMLALHRAQGRFAHRLGRAIAATWWLSAGVVGCVMLALWFGTDHSMAAANRNLLLFSPLAFGFLPWLALRRGPGLARATWWVCAAMTTAACALLFLSVRDQDNLEWLMLSLPMLVATRWLLAPPDMPSDAA